MKRVFVILALISIAVFSCKKKDTPAPPPVVPTVTTAVITDITTSSAKSGGTVVSNGGATITASGIVWSKSNNTPTLADSVVTNTVPSGPFTCNITGLDFNKTYYIRAFATNSVGTGYGNVLTLNTTNDTTKVRFMYNGQEVVYGIIISPTTGKKWLDRNLGATRLASAWNDYQAYGDLFQWGRPADGHQLINWTSSTAGTAVNGMTNVLATSDNPGHNNFINATASSFGDWRDDNNRNRWVTLPQGPCPAGWHVPTASEWEAETSNSMGGTATSGGMTDRNTAFGLLKLPSAGYRIGTGSSAGQLNKTGDLGFYWSSSDHLFFGNTTGRDLEFAVTYVQVARIEKSIGQTIRCIKD